MLKCLSIVSMQTNFICKIKINVLKMFNYNITKFYSKQNHEKNYLYDHNYKILKIINFAKI